MISTACGKQGPPLPPLVRVPAAPSNVAVDRRGDSVDLTFTVPSSNTDNTHPANVDQVDVYAITAPATVTDDQLLKRGTKIGSVDVKAPRDPDKAADEDEPAEDAEPAVGNGLDQGAEAHVSEALTPDALKPADLSKPGKRARIAEGSGPLLGPPPTTPTRVYALVGVSPDGKRGAWSRHLAVPLVPPPPAPDRPEVAYDEKSITVSWAALPHASSNDVLPSRPFGAPALSIAYNVYDVSHAGGMKLTPKPIAETRFVDTRVTWGERRCYVVRAVETVGEMTIESGAAPPKCETLTDTFPPRPPANLKTVASEGVINLIWDANGEPDLVGYIVFRGTGADLSPLMSSPIAEPHYEDKVDAGVRYVYAVKAIDKAGNASDFSNRQEETAR